MPLLYHILYAIQPFYSHFSGSFHTKNREKRRNFLNSHTGGLQAQKLSCRTVTAAPTLRRGRHGMPRSPPFLPLLPYAESRSAAPDLPSAAPYPAVRSLFGRRPFDRRINRTVHWRFLSLFACADLAAPSRGAQSSSAGIAGGISFSFACSACRHSGRAVAPILPAAHKSRPKRPNRYAIVPCDP